jgi:hypothetical protein
MTMDRAIRFKSIPIGIGHLVKAMQQSGFGQAEVEAMRAFLRDHKGKAIGVGDGIVGFVDDCYSREWNFNPLIITEIYDTRNHDIALPNGE